MKNDNQELKMLTQGFFVWLVSGLLVFAAWLICSLLIFSVLLYFTDLSNLFNAFIAATSAAVIVGKIIYRFLKIS